MAESADLPEGLAKPALRALEQHGYTSLDRVSEATEAELLRLHGIGKNAVAELRRALEARGMGFAER